MSQTTGVRYLTIVRHAEATAKGPRGADFDRPLSERGRRQCDELRGWASDSSALGRFGPVTALVSSSRRTRETFEWGLDVGDFVAEVYFSELIYNGVRDVRAEDLLSELAVTDPVGNSLCVVAHSPTVLELLFTLTGRLDVDLQRSGYPLGGAFVLRLDSDGPGARAHYELVDQFVPSS